MCLFSAEKPIYQSDIVQKEQRKSQGKEEVYYIRSRIELVVSAIITFTILVLLVTPIYLLYHLVVDIGSHRSLAACIAVLLVFTFLFSVVLSQFTRAKRHEIYASTAA